MPFWKTNIISFILLYFTFAFKHNKFNLIYVCPYFLVGFTLIVLIRFAS